MDVHFCHKSVWINIISTKEQIYEHKAHHCEVMSDMSEQMVKEGKHIPLNVDTQATKKGNLIIHKCRD